MSEAEAELLCTTKDAAYGRNRMSKVWIGTSGWTYDGWRGPFYPSDLAKKNWLCFYSHHFPTTEINGSFYRTPSLEAVKAWRDQTPAAFLFAWKASKFITHWKRLSENCANSIELMETRLKALSPKVGAVLFQLPPQFSKNRERLASFLGMLPRCYSYAFSNFAIKAGTTMTSTSFCARMTSRSAFPIIMTRHRPGR